MHMVQDTNGSHKIEGVIVKWQFDEGRLHERFERSIRRQHAGRRVAACRLSEVGAGQFEQFAASAANVQPSQFPWPAPRALQEPTDQKPLPAVKMDRITREAISERVIEQLGIGGRVPVKLRGYFVALFQGLRPFAP
jgi:hypothetical protein